MAEQSTLAKLRQQVRGWTWLPDDVGYDEARSLYNGMIDKRPGIVVRAADVADVIATVRFAAEHGILLAVRGGGHNGPGLGSCDDGIVLDLGYLRGVRVDLSANTIRAEGGCTQGDVDHAGHPFGLTVPAGIVSTTGLGGLTLGGGHGYLARRYGLTIDNLIEADVVLADGRMVTASADEHPDLFWALRGGGGNFGVVTSFLYAAREVREVFAGITLWDAAYAREVMEWYRGFLPNAPEEVYGFLSLQNVPPAPMFPQELHGRSAVAILWCLTCPHEDAEGLLAPLGRLQRPLFQHLGPMPFPALQTLFDPLFPPGMQWYWKGDFVRELSDEAIDEHVEHGTNLPTLLSTMHLYPIDGAVHRVGRADTAFNHRDATWSMVIAGIDPDPANAPKLTDWARRYWAALHPHTQGAAYVNFMMEEGDERLRATYRENYDRLVDVKTEYDPDNVLRVNQNIAPEVGARAQRR